TYRLTHRPQKPEARQVVLQRVLLTPADESTYRGRSCIEDIDLMAVDHVPEAVRARVVRGPFVHEHGGTKGKRPIDDVAVPGHPADVGGAPINIIILDIEDDLGGICHLCQVSAGRM